MTELSIHNIVRAAPTLSPADRVERAVALLHRHGLPALVVAEEARPVGLFVEEALLGSAEPGAEAPLESLHARRVGDFVVPLPGFVREDMSVKEAAELFRITRAAVLVAVNEAGRYSGLLVRKDVLAALCNVVYPGPLAGMATPLGVYLTNGKVRAGAGNIGLFLAGVMLSSMWLFATGLVTLIILLAQRYGGVPLLAMRYGVDNNIGALYFGHYHLWLAAFFVAQIVIFFVLMRLLPLSGTHGAEHMVVHAIEQGEELTCEAVAAHTTVHPRCGTNLAAMAMLVMAALYYFEMKPPASVAGTFVFAIAVFIVALLLRRRIGGVLQRLITTRRPSPRQLEAAVVVGRQLLDGCRRAPRTKALFYMRIWNMGLVQVLSGAGLTLYLLGLAEEYILRHVLP